ncbi:N,N-dimethylformamidase beta subunit family domain-containing protein [Micromonospora echinospora]|uniref:N,N-dimethylformamidase beta subunit family domain-containing protein n=1 Tax=Micromonospora echinospora TaxID=1877 RepID=UPI0033F60D62
MAGVRRRRALGLLALGASAATAGALWPTASDDRRAVAGRLGSPDRNPTGSARSATPTGPVPVVRENQAPGITWPPTDGRRSGVDDRRRQIQGYASATSVAHGETIDFHVAVDPAGPYRITVVRLGWYGGAGARELLTSPKLTGGPQPLPVPHPETGALACRWPVSWTLRIPDDWTSGLYQAVFTSAEGWRGYTPFVVRDDRRAAALCVVVPFTTYQAYNQWPMDGTVGQSLYYGYRHGVLDYERRAFDVSYDRPYAGEGWPKHLDRDHDFVRWAEKRGYDLTYATTEDLHSGRLAPARHRGLVFCGHDEYWSRAMRIAAERAVAAGTSLAFLAANSVYWHIRLGPSADGRPERLVTCYKTSPDPDPDADAAGATTQWRAVAPDGSDAEQRLLGIQYNGIVATPQPLVVAAAEHWFWTGCGVADGDRIPGLVGGEADGTVPRNPRPAGVTGVTLGTASYQNRYRQQRTQQTHLYETPQGGVVFAAGTLFWTMALNRNGHRDERVERATANLMDRMTRS